MKLAADLPDVHRRVAQRYEARVPLQERVDGFDFCVDEGGQLR